MNQKQCDIVQDLLTLYADGLTSTSSNEMIEEHLQSCDDCKALLEQYKQPIAVESFPQKEVDYLKKVRRKIKKTHLITGILAVLLIAVFLRIFLIGELTPFHEIDNVSYTFSEETNTVTISGILRNSEKSVGFVRAYPVKDANATRIEVHSVMSSFIHKDNHFSVSIPYTDDLYVELQEDGNRQMLTTASIFLPHICEVSNGKIIDGDLLETRAQGEEIKAIIAAAADTGIKTDVQEPQADNYIQITLTGSGQHSLTSEFPRWCIYVYQKGSNYYAESPGENIKQLSLEDYGKIYSYMEHVKELHRRASTDLSPQDVLYQASQDPENEAYQWSIHELLLTPDADLESVFADYAKKYEQYVHYYQESYAHDEESLKAIRLEWLSVVGENGNEGYISAVDLEWPGWWIPREEVLEIVEPYRGQYRAIPVFASDFSEIIDYFLISIG